MRAPAWIRGWLPGRGRLDSAVLGRLGERRAARYLVQQGLEIIGRNVRLAGAEIDLVARQGRTLVFVEVKSTGEGSWSEGFEKIDAAKRRCLRRGCRAYIQRLSREPWSYRLDGLSVRFTASRFWPRVTEIRWERGLFAIDE